MHHLVVVCGLGLLFGACAGVAAVAPAPALPASEPQSEVIKSTPSAVFSDPVEPVTTPEEEGSEVASDELSNEPDLVEPGKIKPRQGNLLPHKPGQVVCGGGVLCDAEIDPACEAPVEK